MADQVRHVGFVGVGTMGEPMAANLLRAGHAVAVHCKAGLGRTGTVLAMYAIWHSPIVCDGSKSITKVRSLNAGMIQSVAQEAFLAQFAREVAQVRQSRSHASAD